MDEIFTFWEGEMPSYIKLCMKTWKKKYTLLTFNNLNQYTSLPIRRIKDFTLPQISDIIRVHVLRDNGGYWMDADTIMISDKLPIETMVGVPGTRAHHCGQLHTDKNNPMFIAWADYQDKIINSNNTPTYWGTFVNSFTDEYVKNHLEISIKDRTCYFPELYMVKGDMQNCDKYIEFYFKKSYHLSDLRPADILMLHNSWTPDWYKKLNSDEVLKTNCTMSNILKEVLECSE